MNRAGAIALLLLMAVATTGALVAPWPIAGALALAALVGMRRGRGSFAAFAGITLAINVLIVAVAQGRWTTDGLAGALRLCAAVGANFALLSWSGIAQLIDGLRLPPRPTALLAAILLAAEDLGRDLERIRMVRRLEGAKGGRLASAREAGRHLGPLVVGAHARAAARRDALHVAGLPMPAWFVPFVAIAALCAAGRMAFLAFPNVALTYLVAFLGGMVAGPLVAAAAAFAGMALTDLLLTGLYPAGFVNAPAMALLALLGAAMRRVDLGSASGRMIAASVGILGTLAFSLATDAMTWLLLYAHDRSILAPMLVAGLAFNALPALVNGALFAWGVTPARAAVDAWRRGARARARGRGTGPEPGPEGPPPASGAGSA